MENKDLKTMSVEQLNKKAQEVRKSLFELRMKNTVGQLNNPIEIRDTRKTVARIMTAISAHNKTAPVAKTAAKTTTAKTKTTKTTKAKAGKTSKAKK